MASRANASPLTAKLDDLEGLLSSISSKYRTGIACAASLFGRVVAERGFRVSVLQNLSCPAVMRDERGSALHESAFGWEGRTYGLWNSHEEALRAQIIQACRVEGEAFWANESGFRTKWRNPLLDKIDLSDFERKCRTKAAFITPVYAPFGQISAVVFTSTDPVRTDLSNACQLHAPFLTALSRHFVSGYIGATRTSRYLPTPSVLTNREVECLRWAAFGKTDHEIAIILARTHGTIRYHLKGICSKLDAVNRAHAIFKATQLGYISTTD